MEEKESEKLCVTTIQHLNSYRLMKVVHQSFFDLNGPFEFENVNGISAGKWVRIMDKEKFPEDLILRTIGTHF